MAKGRPSKLTPDQWDKIGKRLLGGETTRALAKEFGVSASSISQRFSEHHKQAKAVADQLVSAEANLRGLPLTVQITALNLADELRAVSYHLAGAAKFGSATAHRLAGIAHTQAMQIDDAEPLRGESLGSLRGIAALTKTANDSSQIGLGLLAANKEMIAKANAGDLRGNAELLKELVQHLPN